MKRNTINLSLYSAIHNEKAMQAICGQWKSDIETKQIASYTVENGQATITAFEPVYAINVNIPLPFILPIHDLGSGILKSVEINIDTLSAHEAICPTEDWAHRRMQQPVLYTQQALWADYNSLA